MLWRSLLQESLNTTGETFDATSDFTAVLAACSRACYGCRRFLTPFGVGKPLAYLRPPIIYAYRIFLFCLFLVEHADAVQRYMLGFVDTAM